MTLDDPPIAVAVPVLTEHCEPASAHCWATTSPSVTSSSVSTSSSSARLLSSTVRQYRIPAESAATAPSPPTSSGRIVSSTVQTYRIPPPSTTTITTFQYTVPPPSASADSQFVICPYCRQSVWTLTMLEAKGWFGCRTFSTRHSCPNCRHVVSVPSSSRQQPP